MRTARQIDSAKSAQTARLGQSGAEGKRKRCRKGKRCGASCISSSKFCLVDLPWVSSGLSSARNQIVNRPRPATPVPAPTPAPAPKPKPEPKPTPKPDNRRVSEKLREALPKFTINDPKPGQQLTLSQKVDGYNLAIYFAPYRDITFSVNGDLIAPLDMPDKTGVRIANQVRVAAREFFKNIPDGTTFSVSAVTIDGKGEQRVKSYRRIGFSEPTAVGNEQAGVVRGGKLYPIDPKEFWADKTKLEFSETSSKDEIRETIAWFTVLYGREPKLSAASLSNLD